MTSPRQLPTHSVQFPIISLILAFSSQSHSTVVRGKIPSETYLLLMLTKPIPQKSLGKTLSFLILVVTLIPDPHNLNPRVPSPTGTGMNQCAWEPLFILNYETGKIESWTGESFTSNQKLDVWTLTIRPGVEWSDGEAFTADDVVFTINTLLNDRTQSLGNAASMQQWVKRVEKTGLRTVRFDLKSPNPRFKLDYFSVRVGSSMVIYYPNIFGPTKTRPPSNFATPTKAGQLVQAPTGWLVPA